MMRLYFIGEKMKDIWLNSSELEIKVSYWYVNHGYWSIKKIIITMHKSIVMKILIISFMFQEIWFS